jgi:pilus assembly protein TadC
MDAPSGEAGAVTIASASLAGLAAALAVIAFANAAWRSLPPPPARVGRDPRRRRARRHADRQVASGLADALDLAVVAAGAGLTVPMVVAELARASPYVLADAFRRADADIRCGARVADTLASVAGQLGDPVRPFVAALAASARDGVPLVEPLQRLADRAHDARRRAGEHAARRLSVQLLFPLVTCILPAFVLLGIVPVLASSLSDLTLP